jgi:hypothetical protein
MERMVEQALQGHYFRHGAVSMAKALVRVIAERRLVYFELLRRRRQSNMRHEA